MTIRSIKARPTLLFGAAVIAWSGVGCGVTVEDLPLPDPAPGGPTYTVHATFDNALNLPDGAKVKIGGTDVGVVTGIRVRNYEAIVDLEISQDISLPHGSSAELRQATPLGDVFVALAAPQRPVGAGVLGDGDVITRADTSAGATVEELLITVSLLTNNGLADLSKIGTQLSSIVNGHGGELAHTLTLLTGIVSELNANSSKIDATLTEFNSVTATLETRRNELGQVADSLPSAMGALAENNAAIGDLLARTATATAAIGDFAATTGPELADLLDTVDLLSNALATSGDQMAFTLDQLQQLVGPIHASTEGKSLATYMTITSLELGSLTDHTNSRVPNSADVKDFVGSFLQVLQIVKGRVEGHR
ncbi:MCE family protein [Nocardia sp. SSK8]|uniref:MCE family protein n=1 Tax=Nocardia sp. SSK8 TaxID=3120154 RepID=UPI003008BCF2